MSSFKVGSVVENEFVTPSEGGRDWELGVIVERLKERFKVARIGKDKSGYYWTNQWEIRSAEQLRETSITLEETGLEL